MDESRAQPGKPADFSPATDDPQRDFDPANYVYRSHIGSGAMGDVMEALDVRLRRVVAIKRFKSLALDPVTVERARERMRLEGEVLAKMLHPALLGIFAAGVTRSGCPFLVTERLHGRTLGDEIKERGFIPLAEAISIACAVLAGLGHVHPAIVHRDIKPDNIFLMDAPPGGSRGVKVLDFGLAKVIDASRDPNSPAPLAIATATGTALGTPRFMSPEQATGDKNIDHRADVYGVGATLYAMLVGVAPFDHHKQVHLLMRAHLEEVPRPPSAHGKQTIPPDLDRALLKSLAKDPRERFQTAREFATELLRIAATAERPADQSQGAAVMVKGTMMMDQSVALHAAAQIRDSLASQPAPSAAPAPPTYAATAELPRQAAPPRQEGTTAVPQQYATGLQPARASESRAGDATLVSRPTADDLSAIKQRRALMVIGIITVLSLAILAVIAVLALRT